MKPKKQKKQPADPSSAENTLPEEKNAASANLGQNPTHPASLVGEKKEGAADPASMASTFHEDVAAELLGIKLEDLTALRNQLLSAGVDFVRMEKSVRITASGIRRLKEVLNEGTNLVVLSPHVINPNLVLARLPGNDEIQRVRVANNKEWCKGMVMTGCLRLAAPKFWSTSVRPRFKGRA